MLTHRVRSVLLPNGIPRNFHGLGKYITLLPYSWNALEISGKREFGISRQWTLCIDGFDKGS